jgi:hypothetical protein
MEQGTRSPANRFLTLPVFLAALVLAALSARPYAGGWNDGSRLATVECLVDYHTLSIDRSIFVNVPPSSESPPYNPEQANLLSGGTGDKLFIDGHFYSDKSPVPAVLTAGIYQVFKWTTGLCARDDPARFCYSLTLMTSGPAFVVAILCLSRVGSLLDLAFSLRLALLASLGLSTVALTYAEHVNNHVLLLGVLSALLMGILVLRSRIATEQPFTWVLIGVGSLAGLAYSIDLGAGPVLFILSLGLVAYRCRSLGAVGLFLAAAFPWIILHHVLNYAVGGTFKPANAVPEYFLWPGCSFTPQNMTGSWNHPSFGHFVVYAIALLYGKRGFLAHNLTLLLVLPALAYLLRRRRSDLPEILFAAACCGGVWLAYAMTSNNYSGQCCSIRWFVPLLAPGYFVLALFLRDYPGWRASHLILGSWGALLGILMWLKGPWIEHMVPFLWPIQAGALLSLAGYRYWRRQEAWHSAKDSPSIEPRAAA